MPRPAQLDDPQWLRERYLVAGDARIAAEIGVNPKTVRLARKRLGIASAPSGRRWEGVETQQS